MGSRYDIDRETRYVAFILALILLGIAIALLSGCATFAAVQAAPPDFWTTAESIVKALFTDIGTVVSWFF